MNNMTLYNKNDVVKLVSKPEEIKEDDIGDIFIIDRVITDINEEALESFNKDKMPFYLCKNYNTSVYLGEDEIAPAESGLICAIGIYSLIKQRPPRYIMDINSLLHTTY